MYEYIAGSIMKLRHKNDNELMKEYVKLNIILFKKLKQNQIYKNY